MAKIKFPVIDEDIPTMALFLTILSVMLDPELTEWECHEFWEMLLEGEPELTVDKFKEAVLGLKASRFDAEYDYVN